MIQTSGRFTTNERLILYKEAVDPL